MSAERDELRKVYFDSWYKYNNQLPVEPLEHQIIEIILLHPEYHTLLSNSDNAAIDEYIESNPFLHMSLHLALTEQITTNRPQGITQIYSTLCTQRQDSHIAQHAMIDCLAEIIWNAQKSGKAPDEKEYLQKLRNLTS